MYGLFLRALQNYVRVTFGLDPLDRALQACGAPPEGFEPLLHYERADLRDFLARISAELGRGQDGILEDLGTFIITDEAYSAARRLLRFGGATFVEFLYSLEELPERIRFALPDDDYPVLFLRDQGEGQYRLFCGTGCAELGPLLMGILRAMADDYGALMLIEILDCSEEATILTLTLLDARFSEGRSFDLAAAGGRG